MYTEISSVIASVKTALEIANAANKLSNHNKLIAALYEVNEKLIVATTVALASQEKQSSLSSKISALEKELMEIKSFQSTKKRYLLHALESGMLVYAPKPRVRSPEPMHYLCAHCTDNGKPEKLQPVKTGKLIIYVCHGCDSKVR